MFGLPRWGIYALGALLLVIAFVAERHAYGNRRFNAGEDHADEQWKKASDKLIEKSANAGTKADRAAAARQADFAAKQEETKEKIDAAVQHGQSPFDVVFGAAD